jgi:hypothetical protein
MLADGFERQPKIVKRCGISRRGAQRAFIAGDRCARIACFAVAIGKMKI